MTDGTSGRNRERERRSVWAYLMRRKQDGTLDWSGLLADLVAGAPPEPDSVVTLGNRSEVGIEVTEAIDAESARDASYEDRLAVEMNRVLRHFGGAGLVSMQSGRRPPVENREVRDALVGALEAGIEAAGGIAAFIEGLPNKRWQFRWTESDSTTGVCREGVVVFDFAPFAEHASWRFFRGLVSVGTSAPELDLVERLILERVREKAVKASTYAAHSGGLHLLVVNVFGAHSPSPDLIRAVQEAVRGTAVSEVWLLNQDPRTLDAEPPEPFLVRLA